MLAEYSAKIFSELDATKGKKNEAIKNSKINYNKRKAGLDFGAYFSEKHFPEYHQEMLGHLNLT